MQDMPDSTRKSIMGKKDYSESTNIRQTGFIAQEIEQAAKESGYDFNGVHKPANEKDNYSVSYSLFTVPLVKAVQEQQAMINNLKNENQNLLKLIENQNLQLKTQNEQINKLSEQVVKIQQSLSVSGKN
jgi:trimeric autotransporter adhesin